ncbi:MAG: hypothetical protein DMF61_21450 [Blastocatellia bacterium AA13]|nr:MAG: hypothetical protein DMF61_21450 [Blastocatellia bacterium AA13]
MGKQSRPFNVVQACRYDYAKILEFGQGNTGTLKVDLENLITQVEAAEIRGVSVQAISELVKRGKLKTVSLGKRKFLLRSEVEAFEPGAAGRPKKKNGSKAKPTSKK